MSDTTILDTNAILRYILQDDNEKTEKVKDKINANRCLIPTEVVAEVVYVLVKFYKVPRKNSAAAIENFLALANVFPMEATIVCRGLVSFASTKLDFVDCNMAGYQMQGYSIFTFDKKLQNYLKKMA